MPTSRQLFDNAKACFTENIGRLPQRPLVGQLEKTDYLMWNLSKGLLDLTAGVEARLNEIEFHLSQLDKSR